MGSEDEVEQSFGRPCHQTDGRSKQTCELTSSIVPRGTSFHRSVELEFPPIGFDPARLSCCCRGLFPGPAELGAVNPDAVHDHGQPACQRHDRLFHPAAPGDLHRPGLEPRPFLRTHHALSCFVEHRPASSRLHSGIFCRPNRPRPIDTWRTSVQTPPRQTWICGNERARRQWLDRSATPRGQHQGSSSGAGIPRHPGRWPAGGGAGCRTAREVSVSASTSALLARSNSNAASGTSA